MVVLIRGIIFLNGVEKMRRKLEVPHSADSHFICCLPASAALGLVTTRRPEDGMVMFDRLGRAARSIFSTAADVFRKSRCVGRQAVSPGSRSGAPGRAKRKCQNCPAC